MRRGSVPAQFLALATGWGSSFLFMKVALDGVSPIQVVFIRLLLGAIVLAVVMALTRRRWPRDPTTWGHLAVISLLLCVVPFSLFAWAGQYLPSGLSSIYNATTPIMTLLISLAVLPQERLTGWRTGGILVAALGVVVVVAPWTAAGDLFDGRRLLAQLACLGATTSYGCAFAYTRRFLRDTTLDAPTVAATQVALGALFAAALMPFAGRDPVTLTAPVVLSLVALGALGTGIAYIWNTRVLQEWGATLASTVTYLTPVVGVVLGILILGETLHWNEPVGAVLVVVGILASQGRLTGLVARLRRTA